MNRVGKFQNALIWARSASFVRQLPCSAEHIPQHRGRIVTTVMETRETSPRCAQDMFENRVSCFLVKRYNPCSTDFWAISVRIFVLHKVCWSDAKCTDFKRLHFRHYAAKRSAFMPLRMDS